VHGEMGRNKFNVAGEAKRQYCSENRIGLEKGLT